MTNTSVSKPIPYRSVRRTLDAFAGRRDRRYGTTRDPAQPATPWLRENVHAWEDRCALRFGTARTRADAALRRVRVAEDRIEQLERIIAVENAEVVVLRAAEAAPPVRLGTERLLADAQVADRTRTERRSVTSRAEQGIAALRHELEERTTERAAAAADVQQEWSTAWWQAQRSAEFHCRRSAVYSRAFLRGTTAGDEHPLRREQGPINRFPEQCPWLTAL